MSYLGSISNFDYKSGDWTLFRIRIEQFFKANAVKEENKCAILITHLTDDSCRLARNLVYPREVQKLTYSELVNALDDHFEPKRCTFADRANFYSATREPAESLAEWAARLRGLASFCEFGSALETVLRDRFVLGLQKGPERKKLFDQDATKLTFTEALEIAEKAASAKLAKLSVEELKVSETSVKQEPIFKMETSGGKYRGGGAGRGGAGSSRGRAAVESWRQTTVHGDTATPRFRCEVCGLHNHSAEMCRYKGYRCQKCGIKGHLKKVCKVRVHNINVDDISSNQSEEDCEECQCYNIRYDSYKPIVITVRVDSKEVTMEVDSGASISAMSDDFYKKNFGHLSLSSCNMKMCFYNGHRITPIGYFVPNVSYNNITQKIIFFVIKNGGSPLLGRDFMYKFNLDILPTDDHKTIYANNIKDCYEGEMSNLLKKYKDLWSDGLGRFNKFKISFTLKNTATPKFFKSRSVPFALKSKVNDEIDNLSSLGILVPVTHSDYATPIVPVLKSDGKIKIAGDYSLTLNRDLCIDKYPMPRVEEVFCKLGGGEKYTKLDLSNAYNQLVLDDDSQCLTTINTPRGLFKYTRLVYGLANAPAIFQRTMETLLSGIDGVSCWLDDVCLTGPTKSIHMARLQEVLHRLHDAGLKLQKEKCDFFKDSVTYLGFVIDKTGLRSCPKKVKAIMDAPRPTNVTELKRFLGIITYYRTFIPRASSILGPLHELLRKDATWFWGKRQESAFITIKEELSSERVLTHFEPDARLVLSVDAGPAGLGAVLQQGVEGQERPIAFASRSLSTSERNYSQVQKEATAIVFGVKYFHQFLYGREKPFILKTDHRPLIAIFGKKSGVSVMAASRLQRYAIFLSAYNYEICYTSSQNNVVADYFSRAPLNETSSESDVDDQVRYLNFLDDSQLPVSFRVLKQAVDKDKVLQMVIKYINNGWPRKIQCKNIQPYFNCKTDLEVEKGCIIRGHRIIIPSVLREQMLNELHRGHFGMVKTKSIARGKLWWPGIDGDIERAVGACGVCAAVRPAPPRAPPAPWPRPAAPWERIHVDYMQIAQMTFLIVVDAHSKWLECLQMQGLCTKLLINKLKNLFCTFGLPKVIVSDNDPKISNEEFNIFCTNYGITHMTSPIYHPCSNGQAENSVKTCKKMIKCIFKDNHGLNCKEIGDKLLSFLFEYRNSPHCSTGESPAKLMFNRELRGRLDLLFPKSVDNVDAANPPPCRLFVNNQKVWVRCFVSQKSVWKLGYIVKSLGNRMFVVSVDGVGLCTRHVDQLLRYSGGNQSPTFSHTPQRLTHSSEEPLADRTYEITANNQSKINISKDQTFESMSESNASHDNAIDGSEQVVALTSGAIPADLPTESSTSTSTQITNPSSHRYNLRPRNRIIKYF